MPENTTPQFSYTRKVSSLPTKRISMTDRPPAGEDLGEGPGDIEDIHIDDVFDTADKAPYETQRRINRYLSQEPRHHIVQAILGHPSHLPSLTELDYYVPKSRSAIRDQLANLESRHIVAKYTHTPNEGARDLPADFWGPTAFGIEVLFEYKYLRGVPILRALHDHTHKTERIERHERAPRPTLPDEVVSALSYEKPDSVDEVAWDIEETVADLRYTTIFGDAAPAETAGESDAERTLEELF